MGDQDNLHDQLLSLHAISVEIAGLHELGAIQDRALDYCLELTSSELGFIGILREPGTGDHRNGRVELVSDMVMDVAAIRGFDPDPQFYEPVPPDGTSLERGRCRDQRGLLPSHERRRLRIPTASDSLRATLRITKFLGVPLRLKDRVIGMIGVANKASKATDPTTNGFSATFAAQVAVAVDNARLYEQPAPDDRRAPPAPRASHRGRATAVAWPRA